jgi:3-dehydroquinate synthase
VRRYEQSFAVAFDYPVYFLRNALAPTCEVLAEVLDRRGGPRPHNLMVFIDSGVADAHPGTVAALDVWTSARADRVRLLDRPAVVSGGENAKNGWNDVRRVMESLGRHHMCRQSCVLAIGGGGVLDMVGFAVSLVHRGLRLVRMPTTVLSQNDGGVGVKTGMNEHGAKNYAGTFSPPFAVINDSTFLTTLRPSDWIGGVAEAFKVAIIEDAPFLAFLLSNADRLRERDLGAMEEVVFRCATLHLDHIRNGGDPFEFGSSRPLDFGHWSAHQIEVLSDFAMPHGLAVSVGVALDTAYAARTGLIPQSDAERIVAGLRACGLPVWSEQLDRRDARGGPAVFDGLDSFREHLGGRLTLAMPKPVGSRCEIHDVDRAEMERAMAWLRTRQEA